MIDLKLLEEEKPISLDLQGENGSGTKNYNELENKPKINGVELQGDLTLQDLGIIVKAVTDVLLNGVSVVENGVVNIPIASANDFGLVKQGNGLYMSNGKINVLVANDTHIDNRSDGPLLPVNKTDYAFKRVMCDGKGAQWTSEEKASARERMGLEWSTVCDITLNEDTDIFELKDIECSELHIQVIGKISTRRVQIMLNNTNPQLYFDNAILTRDSDLTILDITISKRHDSDVCICTTKSSGTTTSGFHFGGTNYSTTFKRNYDMINKLKLFLFSDGVATVSVFRQGCRIVVYGR